MPLSSKSAKSAAKLVLALVMIGFMPFAANAQVAEAPLVPLSFTDIAEKVSPVVVNIKTLQPPKKNYGSPFFNDMPEMNDPNNPLSELFEYFLNEQNSGDEPVEYMGSGFIWDTDGHVVTNYHVVEDAVEITVKVADVEYPAKLVGSDANTDLALLKVEVPKGVVLPAAVLGDSDAIKVGEWVVAIGSPFGLETTVTAGIISAKGRVIGSGPYDDFIQTDTAINQGNSGGPLINLKGEVIGINTAIVLWGQGLGFAIPINMVSKIIGELKEHGEVTRGWIGVLIQDATPEIAEYYGVKGRKGVILSEVYAGHPAAEAGLQAGDFVYELNGVQIDSMHKLTSQVANIPVGETAEIKALRGGKEMSFKVKVGKRDEAQLAGLSGMEQERYPAVAEDDAYGLNLSDLNPDLAKKLGLEEKSGVVVTAVKAKSAAAKAGLRVGDIIKEVNRQKVNTVAEYNKAVDKLKEKDELKLFIWRSSEGFKVIDIKP